MNSIGETLRRERIRQGFDIPQIATRTKIGLHLIEAIEADQFDHLPGGVFARSFVRQYARLLGLDEEELVRQFNQQFEAPASAVPLPESSHSTLHFPQVPPLEDFRQRFGSDSSLRALRWVVVAILACAGVYTHWQNRERAVVKIEPIAKAERPPAQAAAPVSVPANDAVPSPPAKPEFRPAEISESGAIHVPPAPVQPSVLPGQPPANTALMQVAFTATEPVWVSVRSDGARAYSGTLEGRQSREFGASKKMTVLTGNAGALEISLNGKPVGPLGPRGEIRLIELTPRGAHVVSRTPPPTVEDPAGERP